MPVWFCKKKHANTLAADVCQKCRLEKKKAKRKVK